MVIKRWRVAALMLANAPNSLDLRAYDIIMEAGQGLHLQASGWREVPLPRKYICCMIAKTEGLATSRHKVLHEA